MRLHEHCLECEEKLGKPFEVVHRWLDEYARLYRHDPVTMHNHWRHRHHKEGVEEVRRKWGDEAAKAAELHIMSDFGKLLGENELEEWLSGPSPCSAPDLTRVLQSCRYWAGVAECECDSEHPIGGCLKCDMDEAVTTIEGSAENQALTR